MDNQYTHHPDYTCLAQVATFNAGHRQIERYTFPFSAVNGKNEKLAVMGAIAEAMESRRKRGMDAGRLHVEMDLEHPGHGRVVDHLPRSEGKSVEITPTETEALKDEADNV